MNNNTKTIVEYISEFGDNTSFGVVISSSYSEDWEENEYEILGGDGQIEFVPERGIITFFNED